MDDFKLILTELKRECDICSELANIAYGLNGNENTRTAFTQKVTTFMPEIMKTLSCIIGKLEQKTKVADLIKNKDYSYIEWRITTPKDFPSLDTLFGVCKSENGKIVNFENDAEDYNEESEVVRFKEWVNDDGQNEMIVVVKALWEGEE